MSNILAVLDGVPSDVNLGTDRQTTQLLDYVKPFERDISIDALIEIIDECKKKFTDPDTGRAWGATGTASDQWLAPRLHAALRLTKREATSAGVWLYLNLFLFPDYVQWRWKPERQHALSFTTSVKKNPFKRLWWGAEMFRNGTDYSAVEVGFRRSDIANTSLDTRVMNNRAVAQAVLRFLEHHELTSRQVNPLSTQLRTSAVTVALDTACPNYSEALELDFDWIRSVPFGSDIIREPIGPAHGTVSEDEVSRAEKTLEEVIDLARVKNYRQDDSTS